MYELQELRYWLEPPEPEIIGYCAECGQDIFAGKDLPEAQEEIKEEKKKAADDKTINLLVSEIKKYNGQAEKIKQGILTKYKVKELFELTESQANQAINKLKNFKKKEEKSNAE